ncbi:MAG: hypothetical protein M1821_002843 [Bathelium mastoideum]|nr:MAG: hypothetical protein M1821_002843 [Bathelium mastoideum]
MALIRIAIIGLSASAKTSWAAEGHLTYLLSPPGQSKYRIVALLNSSVAAARAAIKTFGLPAETRVYGAPQALAKDPDVDLVVNNTRVDLHAATIRPSIEAGKDVFVEWPLAHSLAAATELEDLAKQKGVRTVVGLQGRVSPVILKVTEVLGGGDDGRIGKVLSSEVTSFGSLMKRDSLPEGLAYFAEREVGGNCVTIAFAHMIDFIHSVLGEFSSFQSHAQIQHPELAIRDARLGAAGGSGSVLRTVKSNVPDFLSVHGTLEPSSLVTHGATLSVTYRTGPAFPGSPAFVWSIAGTKGELRVVSPAGPFLQSDSYGSVENPERITIEIHNFATNAVESVAWDWTDLEKSLTMVRGRLGADVYERFAAGGEKGKWPAFEDAVRRHQELEEIWESFDRQNAGD